ncbi:MAG: VWA domain-containing protein [Promethearchaeota archaeon]
MSELRVPENVVICIDTSRSMFRTDFAPNRLICCIKAVKKLITDRFNSDNSSAFAIIKFSDTAKKVVDFTSSTFMNSLYSALDSLKPEGCSAMGEGLALSIKTVIIELRKIEAKSPKILLVSDGNYTKDTSVDPLKMARLAEGLNIKIDTFRVGNVGQGNILKKVSDITGGKHYFNSDGETLLYSAHNFAEANIKTYGKKEVNIENPAFLRKIAATLLRVQDLTKDQEQRIKQLRGEADFKKCSICFSDKNPYTKGSFYVTGRYCPNCQTPFHIHCLSAWADSQHSTKLKKSGTARCPHCFYLLKIPTEVTQIQKLRVLTKGQKEVSFQKPQTFSAKLINSDELRDDALYSSCPVCQFIFEKGQKVVKCGNPECGQLYHKDCFQKLLNSQCKQCGVKLDLH